MLDTLLVAMAVAVAAPQIDTTVQVDRGDRLAIAELQGELLIKGWDRDEIEVSDDRAERITVRRSGSTLAIGGRGGRDRSSVEAVIRVPRWMDVSIAGTSLDITLQGLDGVLEIGTVSGDVIVEEVGGPVDVRTVSGDIRVVDARGGVSASSQGDDVALYRVSGPIEAHSGDGDVELEDVTSSSVHVEVQDGDIVYAGDVADDGDYGFYAHDGDVVIAIPGDTNASVHVSTFDGEFETEFTIRVERFTAGREFDFVLGTGAARIEVEVFEGDIALVRN
jgi:hypothetical protein